MIQHKGNFIISPPGSGKCLTFAANSDLDLVVQLTSIFVPTCNPWIEGMDPAREALIVCLSVRPSKDTCMGCNVATTKSPMKHKVNTLKRKRYQYIIDSVRKGRYRMVTSSI